MNEASLRAPRQLKKLIWQLIDPAPAGKSMIFYPGKSMIFIIKASWKNELVATPVLACGSASGA